MGLYGKGEGFSVLRSETIGLRGGAGGVKMGLQKQGKLLEAHICLPLLVLS